MRYAIPNKFEIKKITTWIKINNTSGEKSMPENIGNLFLNGSRRGSVNCINIISRGLYGLGLNQLAIALNKIA